MDTITVDHSDLRIEAIDIELNASDAIYIADFAAIKFIQITTHRVVIFSSS